MLKVISRSTFDLQPVLDTLVEFGCAAVRSRMARSSAEGSSIISSRRLTVLADFIEYMKNVTVDPTAARSTGRALLEGKIIHVADVLADPEYTFERHPEAWALPHPSGRSAPARGHANRRARTNASDRCGHSPTSRSSWYRHSPTRQ